MFIAREKRVRTLDTFNSIHPFQICTFNYLVHFYYSFLDKYESINAKFCLFLLQECDKNLVINIYPRGEWIWHTQIN